MGVAWSRTLTFSRLDRLRSSTHHARRARRILPGFLPPGPLNALPTRWATPLHEMPAVSGVAVAEAEAIAPLPQDLVGNRVWPTRDQRTQPMCTAYATIACLELLSAGDSNAIPSYSDSFLYYFMAKNASAAAGSGDRLGFDGFTKGFTRFEDAKSALATYGYCGLDVWSDSNSGDPSQAAIDAAVVHKTSQVTVQSYPPGTARPSGLARQVYSELANKRPVGIGMPAYKQTQDPSSNNWTSAWRDGKVLMPGAEDQIDLDSGHAVCVVGFVTPETVGQPLEDGWFVFRNSFGPSFAEAPAGDEPQGYGAMPARLVDQACWSLLLMHD